MLALMQPASPSAETLRLECRWSLHFDTSTNQTQEHEGLAAFTIYMRPGGDFEMRRTGLETPFKVHASPDTFSARAEHIVADYRVEEFVKIDRRTGEIEAWTMMGEAGGAFMGRCEAVGGVAER